MRSQHIDVWIGGAIVAFGAFVLLVLIPFGVVMPDHIPARSISPAFWPKTTAWMLIVFGAIVALESLSKPANEATADETEHPIGAAGFRSVVFRMVLGFGLLYAMWGTIQWVGLPAASIAIIFVFGILFKERRHWLLAIVALLIPLALYYFFTEIANVPIPLGSFFE